MSEKSQLKGWDLPLFSLVFFTGGHATADVALGLVFFQNLLGLQVQLPVELRQPLGDILMHCGFTDAELMGRLPHGGFVFYDVQGEVACPLFQIVVDSSPLPL